MRKESELERTSSVSRNHDEQEDSESLVPGFVPKTIRTRDQIDKKTGTSPNFPANWSVVVCCLNPILKIVPLATKQYNERLNPRATTTNCDDLWETNQGTSIRKWQIRKCDICVPANQRWLVCKSSGKAVQWIRVGVTANMGHETIFPGAVEGSR